MDIKKWLKENSLEGCAGCPATDCQTCGAALEYHKKGGPCEGCLAVSDCMFCSVMKKLQESD